MELNNNAATAYKVSEPQLGAIYMRSKMDNVNEEKNQRLHDVHKTSLFVGVPLFVVDARQGRRCVFSLNCAFYVDFIF